MQLEDYSELFNKLKSGEIDVDSIQKKERHISELSVDELEVQVMPSGFPSLDEVLFLKENRGELIIVGGRPSSGKSAFMFQMAAFIANSQPVHIFSAEMDFQQILGRLVAGKLNKSLTAIQLGYVDKVDLAHAHRELSNLKYYVDDTAGIDIMELCDRAIETQRRIGTKALFIDYLQLLDCEKRTSRNEEVSHMSRTLKSLARTLNVPVIVGSQLSRANERRAVETGDYRPISSDLRDSGAIEQDADIIAFVHREYMYTGNSPNDAEILVTKNRNGVTKNVKMQFSAYQTKFIDSGGGI